MCCNFVMVWHLLIRAVVCSKHVVHGIGLFGGCSLLFFFLDLKHVVNEGEADFNHRAVLHACLEIVDFGTHCSRDIISQEGG